MASLGKKVLGESSQNQNVVNNKRKSEECEPSTSKRMCLKEQNKIVEKQWSVFHPKEKRKSKMANSSKVEMKEKLINELTPSSTIATLNCRPTMEFVTPLPNFDWADSNEVWNLMVKNDQLYSRDAALFSKHPTLQPFMRTTLLDWLNEVCQAYSLTRQTYYLALDFFDRYLSKNSDIQKKFLQLLGITCLFIAAKIEEIFPPKLSRFAFVCDGACDESEILQKELVVLSTLKWELFPMTPISWLNVYIQIYSSLDKENFNKQVGESFLLPDFQPKLFVQIAHLIDLSTLDAGSLAFPYSVIAASALFHFTNEDVVLQCTGKSIPEMTTCISWMIPFALAIKNEGLDFVNRLPLDGTTTTLQTHTISLELLQNAHKIQANLESEKMTIHESDDDSSLYFTSPTKAPFTPPRSP